MCWDTAEGPAPAWCEPLGGAGRGRSDPALARPPAVTQRVSLPAVSTAARPASSRATGTRNGEQET